MRDGRWLVVGLLLGLLGCVVERGAVPEGLGSFTVEVVSIDGLEWPEGCDPAGGHGTLECPRPFPNANSPVGVRLRVSALDRKGVATPFDGPVLLDVRPGEITDVGPAGLQVILSGGVSEEIAVNLIHAYGPVRFWVEECGSSAEPGSFATGISEPIYFDAPRIGELNATLDNTTSPLTPRASNACVISGDPRYGIGTNYDDEVAFVGYSQGGAVNAPPPATGNFVELVGCTREEHDEALAAGGSCVRGPLVVTGIANEGFYLTDVNAASMAEGFNHLYVFNFSYPDNLEVGDVVTRLRGSPVEFSGSTQLGFPVWVRDGVGRGRDLIPAPVSLSKDVYENSLRSYGRNKSDSLELESLESAVVCVDGIAPASRVVQCDVNDSGRVERTGCLLESHDAPLPPLCVTGGSVLAPAHPACDEGSRRPFCLELSMLADRFIQLEPGSEGSAEAEEEKQRRALQACGLKGYLPGNPAEYCCERLCYNDFTCTDASALIGFGQWAGDIYGRYGGEGSEGDPVKMAFITRDADPDFDPVGFAIAERGKPRESRETVRIIGNLRQVLAARPVWVVKARHPGDIEVGGVCP